MLKLLYIVSTLKSTGPTNQLSYIIKHLDRKKFSPHILTLSNEPKTSKIEYFTGVLEVELSSINMSRIKGLFSLRDAVSKKIKTINPDIVHTQGIRADGLLKYIKRPKISTLRNYPFYDYPMKFGKIKGSIMAIAHFRMIKESPNDYVTCSRTISDEYRENKNLKIGYIQNGVDNIKYTPSKDKRTLRKGLYLPLDKKIFICVGSLIKRKNNRILVETFSKHRTKDILLFAGEGPDLNELKSIAASNIIFLGNISNIPKYLQASDVLVSASLAEGLPNTVLEGMACGLPVVLSNIPSHYELLAGEEYDSIFQKNNPEDLLVKIEWALNDKTLSEKSISLIKKNFTAFKMSMLYQAEYVKRVGGYAD